VDTIIVVDDKSNDTTAEIIKEIAEGDRRVTLIQHKVNQGLVRCYCHRI